MALGGSQIFGSGGANAVVSQSPAQQTATVSTVAAGTAYTLTGSTANVVFGTTSPTVTLSLAGTYLLLARAQTSFVGATYAANQQVNYTLNRTNNTPAALAGTAFSGQLPVLTTITDAGPSISMGGVLYTTANTNDIITINGFVSATPSAGSVTVSAATITAIWIHP